MEEIGSACVTQMIDSSSKEILAELNQKRKRIQIWPILATIAGILLIGLLAAKASAWLVVPFAVLSLVGVFFAYQFDIQTKSAVILYDFDAETEAAYQKIHDTFDQLTACSGKWHIKARGNVYDPKYHGGASHLVSRSAFAIGVGEPPFVSTNIAIPFLRFADKSLYFFPERVLLFGRHGVGSVSYDQLSLVISANRFIEDGSLPRDAQVVDHTWQFVNKGGGPDRRFNNNRQLPVCLYEELWLNSPSGLNELIQLSRIGLGEQLEAALQNLEDLVMSKNRVRERVPRSSVDSAGDDYSDAPASSTASLGEPEDTTSSKASSDAKGGLYRVLLETLCCLMVADGYASSTEKKRIVELMAAVQSPWNGSEIEARIASFIARVRAEGYRKTLADTLNEINVFKQTGNQETLRRCLDGVAFADGTLDEREQQLCRRIMALVE
jgi:tellurite resistance protein